MKTILVIILVAAVIAGAIWVATKYFGLFSDKDKDGIPDKVEETAAEVKKRAQRVKEELKDVKDAAKNVVDQAGDVVEAAKGGPRKGRKPAKKQPRKTSPSRNTKGGGSGSGTGREYNTMK
jgi:hypothetical protein